MAHTVRTDAKVLHSEPVAFRCMNMRIWMASVKAAAKLLGRNVKESSVQRFYKIQ